MSSASIARGSRNKSYLRIRERNITRTSNVPSDLLPAFAVNDAHFNNLARDEFLFLEGVPDKFLGGSARQRSVEKIFVLIKVLAELVDPSKERQLSMSEEIEYQLFCAHLSNFDVDDVLPSILAAKTGVILPATTSLA